MAEQIAYRLLSGRQRQPNPAPVTYLPADDPSQARRTRDVLDQYPYLRAREQIWVDRYDESALDDADAFVTAREDDLDAEKAGHDLAVWLCNWVVVNDAGTRSVPRPTRRHLLRRTGQQQHGSTRPIPPRRPMPDPAPARRAPVHREIPRAQRGLARATPLPVTHL